MSETLYAITKSSRDGKAAGHLLETYRDTEQVKHASYFLEFFTNLTNYTNY